VEVKRDMDLIRELLLRIESEPQLDGSHFTVFNNPADFGDHSQEEISYHVDLLFEAGFVKGSRTLDPAPAISKLTWEGHEFVDNIHDPGIWAGVKERIKGLPSVAITVVAELALAEMKKRVHLNK